jgi:4-amino-4-deoxy-L-arabinose transferase-like glycosyltransferase
MVLPVALHDVRDLKPYGDQTSHVYLGLSLAYDSHTFNFDRRDALRWHNAGWVPEPFTLFFQRYDGGWAASKPYGYPAFLAPFIAALGMASGVAIGNALLLLALIGGSLWLALRRFDPLTASLAVGAFYFGGYIYMYAYPANVELFEAATTLAAFGGAYAFRSSGRVGWALFAVVAMAFGVIEKLPLFFLYAPLAAVMLWELRERRKQMLLVFATGLIAVGVAATPYLKYSDGDSFTPYAGERYQLVPNAGSRPPWAGGVLNSDYVPSGADEGAIAKRATTGKLLDRFESLGYYVAGRYTGMLVTVPLALFLLVALLIRLPASNRWAVAGVVGVLAYIAFYIVVFPKNYYGGGQSLGNRYFIQIAPAVFVTALFAPLGVRLVRVMSVAAVAVSVLFSWPQHRAPSDAYIEMIRTSPAQKLLPIEANQDYTWIFRQTPPEN